MSVTLNGRTYHAKRAKNDLLTLDLPKLYDRIVDWAAEFGITLDQQVVKFSAGKKDYIIASLDKELAACDKSTAIKEDKV